MLNKGLIAITEDGLLLYLTLALAVIPRQWIVFIYIIYDLGLQTVTRRGCCL